MKNSYKSGNLYPEINNSELYSLELNNFNNIEWGVLLNYIISLAKFMK